MWDVFFLFIYIPLFLFNIVMIIFFLIFTAFLIRR